MVLSLTHLAVGLTLLSACLPDHNAAPQEQRTDADSRSVPQTPVTSPYLFDSPDATIELPGRLGEISGLTALPDGRLVAVQDELGKLFFIDPMAGAVVDEKEFGPGGDYEGVEFARGSLWVLRSDGNLYEVEDWDSGEPAVTRHKTPLSAKFDTEGLTYDEAHGHLLIACKEYQGKNLKGRKALYAFDLAALALSPMPVVTIDENTLGRRFKPSALAVHPLTGVYYMLSSVERAIAVLEPDGSRIAVWPLPADLFPQPEALAFFTNGDLFVGSEGRGNKGRIHRFNYRGNS